MGPRDSGWAVLGQRLSALSLGGEGGRGYLLSLWGERVEATCLWEDGATAENERYDNGLCPAYALNDGSPAVRSPADRMLGA